MLILENFPDLFSLSEECFMKISSNNVGSFSFGKINCKRKFENTGWSEWVETNQKNRVTYFLDSLKPTGQNLTNFKHRTRSKRVSSREDLRKYFKSIKRIRGNESIL